MEQRSPRRQSALPLRDKVVLATKFGFNCIPNGAPGTTKLNRLEENIGAVSIHLTPADLTQITTAAATLTPEGNRYPEALEAMTNR